jgi:hypothetical protein
MLMRRLAANILCTLCCALSLSGVFVADVWAQDRDEEIESLYQFLHGKYELIGRRPDSNETYTGTAVLKAAQDGLEVLRTVNGATIKGTARMELATHDKVKVLRMRLIDADLGYEATFVVGSDLDNYARLTGYVYPRENKTRRPGLEAWFVDRSPPGAD